MAPDVGGYRSPIQREREAADLEVRPRDPDRRRDAPARLIEEAIRAFGREGYTGASLDQIATAVGIRKQTLLYYFPTKDALLEACLAGRRRARR